MRTQGEDPSTRPGGQPVTVLSHYNLQGLTTHAVICTAGLSALSSRPREVSAGPVTSSWDPGRRAPQAHSCSGTGVLPALPHRPHTHPHHTSGRGRASIGVGLRGGVTVSPCQDRAPGVTQVTQEERPGPHGPESPGRLLKRPHHPPGPLSLTCLLHCRSAGLQASHGRGGRDHHVHRTHVAMRPRHPLVPMTLWKEASPA